MKRQIKSKIGLSSYASLIDFFFTLAGAIVNYPCPDKNWKPFAIRAGDELLRQEKIDAIISSSPPVTSHLIASELRRRYKIPWIADLRDLWSQNHNYSYGPLRKAFDRRLERKIFSATDALITVSQQWAEKLEALHKGKMICTITHGFDPKEINIPPVQLTPKFTITYTGSIYTGKQDPTKLLVALNALISDGVMQPGDIEVSFYGSKVDWLDNEIERRGLSRIAKQYGGVPREVALQKQRQSQLLLLLDWDSKEETGVYTGKIYEYLAARRPILAIGGSINSVVHTLLIETKAGVHAPSVDDIKNILRNLYLEYKAKGEAVYQGIDAEVNKYSHREMARKFADILDCIVKK
ncbi:MAG: glycosyltransferase [Chloroflexota bacterium]